MKIIGITGGIGAGKSSVLSILKREEGSYVIEADTLAHQLMEPGCPAYDRIVEAFGGEILDACGKIDRPQLGRTVFADDKKLKCLNGIVHPAVKEYILTDIEAKRSQGYRYYIIEAALLIEDGYKAVCDELWYIYAGEDVRVRRLLESRGGSLEKWESVMRNQSADAYYRQHCDYIIDNGGLPADTERIVKELLCK